MEKARILIVEDESVIAEDLLDILELEGHNVVGIAHSYDTAIALFSEKKIDLCFIDIALRGRGSGLDLADKINERFKIPFIFLTSFSDKETIEEVVKRNPAAYLVKPFKVRDIAPAIAIARANQKFQQKDLFPNIDLINANLDATLTSQEYKVLSLIWSGYKNQEIADELFVTINTVKTHVTRLFRKMDVSTRSTVIKKALSYKHL